MDSIDNIMNQNRHLMDDAYPPTGHVERFKAKLKNETISIKSKHNSWIYAAATIAILISISFWGISVVNSPLVQQQFTASNSDIYDLNRYYQGQFESKLQMLKKSGEKGVEGDVEIEIKEMETTRQSLIKTYQTDPSNERILNEIVNNYRLQVELLNEVISMQAGSNNDLKL